MNAKSITQQVASELGVEKVMWPRAVKACKEALNCGFTLDDFLLAVRGMKTQDKKYWSIYSIFTKPDYWMNLAPKEKQKGTW